MSKCYSFVYQQHQLSSTKKKSENFPLLSKQERSWMLCFGVLLCVWTNVIWRLMEQTTTQSFLKRIHFFSTDTTHFSYCKMIHFFLLFIFLHLFLSLPRRLKQSRENQQWFVILRIFSFFFVSHSDKPHIFMLQFMLLSFSCSSVELPILLELLFSQICFKLTYRHPLRYFWWNFKCRIFFSLYFCRLYYFPKETFCWGFQQLFEAHFQSGIRDFQNRIILGKNLPNLFFLKHLFRFNMINGLIV